MGCPVSILHRLSCLSVCTLLYPNSSYIHTATDLLHTPTNSAELNRCVE